MRTKKYPIITFVVLLMSFSLACAALGAPATPTAIPPTNTAVPPANTPTPATAVEDDLLDTKAYEHPSGSFSFMPPKDWTIEDTNFDVYVHSPKSVFFYVGVTNTGYELDAESYASFIASTENNYYTFWEDYKEVNREENDAINLVMIEKTYTYDGKLTFARSVYQKFGQSVYVVEMLGDDAEIQVDPIYELTFNAFFKTVNASSDVAATLPVYEARWSFTGPQDAFTINVPIGWQWYSDAPADNVTRDQFWSPDGFALIESVSLDDGTASDMGYAGKYALQVLNSAYTNGSGDVKVISDQIMNDGSERLEWTSRAGGYSGYTFFEVRNKTQVLLLTVVWADDVKDLYNPIMDEVLASYTSAP